MKLKDPVRWSELAGDADAELREILQGVRASGPAPSDIESLVRSIEQVVQAPVAQQTAAHGAQLSAASGFNLVTGTIVAGLACVAVYFLRGEAPTVAPPATSIDAPARPPAAPATDSVRPGTDAEARTPTPMMARAPEAIPQAPLPVERTPAASEIHAQPAVPARARSQERPARMRSQRVADATGRGAVADPSVRQDAEDPETAPQTPSGADPGLATELELLTEAQRALASAPARSLTLVEQHASSFPNGTFAQERDELRIDALCRVGRIDLAKWYAGEFARDYPRSAHLVRIRRVIAKNSR